MGHQITFYTTPKDALELEAKLRSLGPMVILHSDSSSEKPRIVDSIEFTEGGQRWLYFRLARQEDLSLIRMQEIPARSLWSIDSLNSPVVELRHCYFNGKILREGRVYWLDDFYAPNGTRVFHSAEFRSWAAKIRSTVKKFLKPYDGKLIGPDTALWLANKGGRLVEPHETI